MAPGEGAENWAACRAGSYIAFGWHELGNIRGMDRAPFDAHCEALAQMNDRWTVQGMRQVWQFAHEIQFGDRIIANHGFSWILGVGTVTGEYVYVPGGRYPHHRAVHWDSVTPIEVHVPGWRRTLIQLDHARFEALVGGH